MESNSRHLSCFTIGHSDLPVEVFVYYLQKVRVDCIIDVRSAPYSKYQPQYNREEISSVLKQENIEYHYMGDVLGGRYSDPALLFPDGTVDYQKVSKTQKFISGLDEVISLIESGKNVALMCSERDPLRCHRYVLVARNLQNRGVNVTHLCPELVQKSHAELEGQTLSENVGKNQRPLLGNNSENLNQAYLNLNKKMGYRTQPAQAENATKKTILSTVSSENNECPNQSVTNEKKDSQKTLF